jgi:hypothetical protein
MEYEIAEALIGEETFARVCAVMLEWHRRGNVGRPDALVRWLTQTGFVVFGKPEGEGDVGMLYATRRLS